VSWTQYTDDCPGCQPALMDMSGNRIPDDAPEMLAVKEYWKTTTLEQREAFHRVCCNDSRDPKDLALLKGISDGMRNAMNSVPQG
jgi:hypothetical protein